MGKVTAHQTRLEINDFMRLTLSQRPTILHCKDRLHRRLIAPARNRLKMLIPRMQDRQTAILPGE